MGVDDFDNEANLTARRLWANRLTEITNETIQQFPSRMATAAEARETGTYDPLSGMPETLFEGVEWTRDNPEEAVRAAAALYRAGLSIIVEMMRAHWKETGTALRPQ